jgi:hypothetical protein
MSGTFIAGRQPACIVLAAAAMMIGCGRDYTLLDFEKLAPPAGFRVSGAGDGRVVLEWNPVTLGCPARYDVYRDSGAGFSYRNTTIDARFVDDSLSYTLTYRYFVTTLDCDGYQSAPSDTLSASAPNLNAPGTPQAVVFTPHDDSGAVFGAVTWALNDEGDIARYDVFRSPAGGTPSASPAIGWSTTGGYIDRSVVVDSSYRYQVRAVDFGGRTSTPSAVAGDWVLGLPIRVSPPVGATVGAAPVFRWIAPRGAGGTSVIVREESDGAMIWSASLAASTDTLGAAYTGPTLVVGALYDWRIVAWTTDSARPHSTTVWFPFQRIP